MSELTPQQLTEQTSPVAEQPQVEQLPQSAEPDPDYIEFDSRLRKHYGFGGDELKGMYEFYSNQVRESQVTQLKSAWGDAFDDNYRAVEEKLKSLPVAQQQLLNNVEGALLLAKLVQEERAKNPGITPPTLDGSTVPSGTSGFKYTKSQLRKMPQAEYRAQVKEIEAAFAAGLVDPNN
jgi:hypothetical protein